MSEPFLINPVNDLVETAGDLAIKRQQFIPQSFMDDIREQRENSLSHPCGDLMHVARIPVAVIDQWDREGFDYNRAPIQDLLRKLQLDDLEGFITTKKRV